jgi:hypothetical protein
MINYVHRKETQFSLYPIISDLDWVNSFFYAVIHLHYINGPDLKFTKYIKYTNEVGGWDLPAVNLTAGNPDPIISHLEAYIHLSYDNIMRTCTCGELVIEPKLHPSL